MIIFGVNPVREAIRSHPERIRFVAVAKGHGGKLQAMIDEARAAGVAIRTLPPQQVDRLAAGRVHNGVVADVADSVYADFHDLIARDECNFVLLLDEIQDPQNFGAILRVADAFGVDAVVVPEHESAGLTAAAVKASAGASEWVVVAQVKNLARAIGALKDREFWVYAAVAGGDPLTEVDFRGKVAIVLGNESRGIRRNVAEHCDRRIAIPMRGHVDSLNVAAAAAVVCYEVRRGR